MEERRRAWLEEGFRDWDARERKRRARKALGVEVCEEASGGVCLDWRARWRWGKG